MDKYLLALLIVALVLLAYTCYLLMSRPAAPAGEGFYGGPWAPNGDPNSVPYDALNNQLDAIRGSKHDGYRQPPFWQVPGGIDEYLRSGAAVTPDEITAQHLADIYGAEGAEGTGATYDTYRRSGKDVSQERLSDAEREQWFGAAAIDDTAAFNSELMQDAASDSTQYHTPQPAMDHSKFIEDIVLDPRTRDNHRRWVDETLPYSGTSTTVDNLDEAMEATVDFRGLRRPQAVVQYNPLQLTERDTYTLAGNHKFKFK